MRLLRVNPTGFFAYGQHGYIPLDRQGIVLLQGPVGSGKSSLLDAVCEILYGTSPKRDDAGDVSESDVVNRTAGQAFGVVEFEHQGHYYRVAYLRNWKGEPLLTGPSAQDEAGGYSGTSVWFEWWNGTRWEQKGPDGRDLRMARMADTWRRVTEVTGVDYGMFCNACYVAQDQALAFIRGKNVDREEILTKLMRLACYDEGEQRAKDQVGVWRQKAQALQTAISTLQVQEDGIILPDPNTIADQLARSEQRVKRQTDVLADIDKRLVAVRTVAEAASREVIQLQQELAGTVERIHAKTAEVQQYQAGVEQARQRARADMAAIPMSSPALDAARATLMTANTVATTENRRLTGMLPGAGKCPACGSVLDDATLAHHKDEQAQTVRAALDMVAQAEQQVATEAKLVEDAKAARRAEIEQAMADLTTKTDAAVLAIMAEVIKLEAEKAQQQTRVTQASGMLDGGAVRQLESTRADEAMTLRAAEAELANAHAMRQAYDQRAADRKRLTDERVAQEGQLAVAMAEMQEWSWLTKHFPRIKQLKFATGSAFLNDALARHLDVLTGGATHVTVNPFRRKKEAARKKEANLTADDYIFKFEMMVEEGGKTGVPIRLYSGGERERIVLALITAFWELAASQGGGSNVMLLDEATTYLDERSIERVVRHVERLRDTIGTVVLIGHDQALSSLLSPDVVWTAVKRDDDTTVIEQG